MSYISVHFMIAYQFTSLDFSDFKSMSNILLNDHHEKSYQIPLDIKFICIK